MAEEPQKLYKRTSQGRIASPSALALTALNSVITPENNQMLNEEKERVESQAVDQLTKTPRRRGKGKKNSPLGQALTPQIASIGNRILTQALRKYLNVELFALQECLLALEGDPAARARIWERIEGKIETLPDAGPPVRTMADILREISSATPQAVIEAVQSIKFTAPAAPGSAGEAIVSKAMSTDGQDESGSSQGS
jgi:hypothetical protein